MRHFLFIAIAALTLFGAAQTAEAASLENAERLTDAMGLQSEIDKAIGDAVASIRTQLKQQGMAPEKVDDFVTALRDELDAGADDLIGDIARSYADRFSDAEIDDLISFFESPTGRKLVAVQNELAQEQAEAIIRWIAGALDKAAGKLNGASASV